MIAKEPVPGRVKTRLCPPCTPGRGRGTLAEAALADTLAAAVGAGADRVRRSPSTAGRALGARPGVVVVDQGAGDSGGAADHGVDPRARARRC